MSRLELKQESSILALENPSSRLSSHYPKEKTSEIAPARAQDGNVRVFLQIGRDATILTGWTTPLKDDLQRIGGRWNSEARVWRMPAGRSHELLAVCKAKGISVAELGGEESKEQKLF